MSYADQLRAELIEVLACASGPTTTRAARIAITEQRSSAGARLWLKTFIARCRPFSVAARCAVSIVSPAGTPTGN